MKITKNKLTPEDLLILRSAKQKMEQIGWAMQGLNKMGNIIESRIQLLPQKQRNWLQHITYKVLHTVVKTNLLSMNKKAKTTPINNFYMTDAISRASVTMAKCADEFLGETEQKIIANG